MPKKFQFRFNRMLSVVIVVVGVLSAFMLAFNFMQLFDPTYNVKTSLQILYLIVNLIIFAFVIMVLMFTKYRLNKNVIKIWIGFIPVLTIPYSAIAKFVIFPKSQEFFIIYNRSDGLKKHMICLSSGDAAALMDSVSAVYPDVPREKLDLPSDKPDQNSEE